MTDNPRRKSWLFIRINYPQLFPRLSLVVKSGGDSITRMFNPSFQSHFTLIVRPSVCTIFVFKIKGYDPNSESDLVFFLVFQTLKHPNKCAF